MSLLDDFARVDRRQPCPICEKPDWCLVSREGGSDPISAVCARVESRRRFGQAGWLHVLRDDGKRWDGVHRRTVRLEHADPSPERFGGLACKYQHAVDPAKLEFFAKSLGLTVKSLQRLRIGWSGRAYTFPMSDQDGRVIGIHLRYRSGIKRTEDGSRLGLFVPTALAAVEQLLLCEGQTDAAALLDLGFEAIGRPGCRSTLQYCVRLVRKLSVPRVVVIGDSDPDGRNGAANLAAALTAWCRDIRLLFPPQGVKDMREWKTRGATRDDVQAAIDASVMVTLRVRAEEGRAWA